MTHISFPYYCTLAPPLTRHSLSHVHHAIYASDHVSGVERLKEMYTMHGAGTTGWSRMQRPRVAKSATRALAARDLEDEELVRAPLGQRGQLGDEDEVEELEVARLPQVGRVVGVVALAYQARPAQGEGEGAGAGEGQGAGEGEGEGEGEGWR